MPTEQLLAHANEYRKSGLSIVIVNNKKSPAGIHAKWTQYQERIITEAELDDALASPHAHGVGVICGAVSGGLEVIDVDSKNDTTGTLNARVLKAVAVVEIPVFVVSTISGGLHLYYRCEVIEGNQKLAMRPPNASELDANPRARGICLIETRGEGGYVVAPGTPGYEADGDLDIPTVTIDQRDTLLAIMRSFNEVYETKDAPRDKVERERDYALTPWAQFNAEVSADEMRTLLEDKGWTYTKTAGENIHFTRPGKDDGTTSATYHTGTRTFYVFTTSSEFETGAHSPSAVLAVLQFAGNFSLAAKHLVKSGYGHKVRPITRAESQAREKVASGMDDTDIIVDLISAGIPKEEAKAALQGAKTPSAPRTDPPVIFWHRVGVTDRNPLGRMEVPYDELADFLHDYCGFGFIRMENGKKELVQVRKGIVEAVDIKNVKDAAMEYLDGLDGVFEDGYTASDVRRKLMEMNRSFFDKGMMDFLPDHMLDFLRDTADAAFFPFNNLVVEVTKRGARTLTYGEVDRAVWRGEIIDHDIELDQAIDPERTDYGRFLSLVAGSKDPGAQALKSLIGYLLHKYKDPTRSWAVVLAEETEDENLGGGTGKGLFVKALSRLVKTDFYNGKGLDMEKNFAFQRVGLDTRLVAVEDCQRGLDFEAFNSILTEGLTVERKNKPEIYLSFKNSPKFLFSTNYTIPPTGNHGRRRMRTFEFSGYFSPERDPIHEFGRRFFDDWDWQEWNAFYNVMLGASQVYLDRGVIKMEMGIAYSIKTANTRFTKAFTDYIVGFLETYRGEPVFTREQYEAFLKQSGYESRDHSVKWFDKAVMEAGEALGYEVEKTKNRQAGGAWMRVFKITAKFAEVVSFREVPF
jgi:hypothetical protein